LGSTPIGGSGFAMIQPFDVFGIALDMGGSDFSGFNILVDPTLILRPSSFEVNVFIGPGLNMMFINEIYTNFVFNAGLRGGIHLGPGVLFTEARFVGVLCKYDNKSTGNYGTDIAGNMLFSLGYKIGLIPRKK
jgi:hypothetical protein